MIDTKERRAVLALALDCAREAAKIVHAGWRKHPVVEHKGAVDLVTPYDRASEVYVRERLVRETGFACVGEEDGGSRADGSLPTWYVDPLDGTTNFVHGHPFYSVSIGLFEAHAPILGAVVAPSAHLEWTGAVGLGATRNGEPCAVSGVELVEGALLATGFPYDRRVNADNNLATFVSVKMRAQAIRRCGSASMDLCLVADGTYDGYWERRLRPWDLAAGCAIVVAAGGTLSDFDGAPIDVGTGNVLATNGHVHQALLQAIRAPS